MSTGTLTLKPCFSYPPQTHQGINACRGVLEGQEDLERFFVNNNGLSASATHAIVEILTFRTPTKLKVLHFFNNMSGTSPLTE